MSRLSRRAGLAGAAALCLLGLALAPARALAEGRIDRVEVTRTDDALRVSAHLGSGFPERVATQIRSGVPKDLFYTVAVYRRHRHWFDEELYSRTVEYTIKYDTLEGQYHIHRIDPDGAETETVVPDYAAAVETASTVDGVILPLPPPTGDAGHYVSVKAEMRAVRLPLYLDYVFFFIPILEFETPWARSPLLEGLP